MPMTRALQPAPVPWHCGEQATRTVTHVGDPGGVPRRQALVEARGVIERCRDTAEAPRGYKILSCAALPVLHSGGTWRARCGRATLAKRKHALPVMLVTLEVFHGVMFWLKFLALANTAGATTAQHAWC